MTGPPVPLEMLEEGHALIVGTTGSGKTYTLRGLLEQLRHADRRVGAIDKLGNHWGLTLSADGQRPGLDFVIFGGRRAHVPMTPDQGAAIGRLFVERNIPAIFDLSQWTADDQQQWVSAFADTVFLLNQDQPLHLAIDEAQSWVPQGGGGDAFRSVLRLAEQGRGNGVLLIMAVQRLSRIDKSAASMAAGVIAMRQTAPVDRKAVRELVAGQVDDTRAFERELPELKTGTGYLWNPLDHKLDRAKFPPNSTFDSSRTPKHGDRAPAPIAVSSDLVAELTAALAPPEIDDTIPADPAASMAKGAVVGTAIRERDERIRGLETENADLLAELEHLRGVDAECDRYQAGFAAIEKLVDDIRQGRGTSPSQPPSPAVALPCKPEAGRGDRGGVSSISPAPVPASGSTKPRGHKALAVLAEIHPAGLTEPQWSTLAGYARTGGTWGTYKSALRAAAHIEERDGLWFATRAGIAAAGVVPAPLPPPGADRARMWGQRVPGVRRMVDVLIKSWPRATSVEALAADLDMAATGGTFGTYLSRLRANGLLEEEGHGKARVVRLSPAVMRHP